MRFKRISTFLKLIGIGLAGSYCSQSLEVKGGLRDGDPALAQELVREEQGVLLDVRSPQEFSQYSIPGSKNIWVEELSGKLSELERLTEGDKNRPLIVYCTVGVRAARAKRILVASGYTRVSNLGSIYDWPERP